MLTCPTNREIQPLYYLARPSKAALISPFVASSLLPGLTDRSLAVRRICRFFGGRFWVTLQRCGFLQHSGKERKHHSSLVERVTIIHSRTSRVERNSYRPDFLPPPAREESQARRGSSSSSSRPPMSRAAIIRRDTCTHEGTLVARSRHSEYMMKGFFLKVF